MRAKFFLILTAALVCSGECVQVGPQQYGRIEVLAFDILGERIPNPAIDLIEVGSRKSITSKFHDGAMSSQIPYGQYTVRVSASVITSKPAIRYHFKTGQRTSLRTLRCCTVPVVIPARVFSM